jgi:transketolase
MGDQVGVAVSGSLYYVPYKEFERILTLDIDSIEKTALFAALCRINTLYMIARAGSGHIGSSFSSMDIMSWLQLNEIRESLGDGVSSPNDIFFSSKGHDAPALYNTWIGLGKLDFELVHQLRRTNGLPGHPDTSTPNVITNTGSLGMGVSKAKGMIFANRLQQRDGNIFVLTGDGELQEGQFWESLISAANHKLHELTVIVDHNKLQSDMQVNKVSDLGDLESKFTAFGWYVSRCDGNNLDMFSKTLAVTKAVTDKPKVIIADTIKGKGVSFMEHTSIDSDVEFYKFHSGAPTDDAYVRAAQELIEDANSQLKSVDTSMLELEVITRPAVPQPENPQRLIAAYSSALIKQARKNKEIVALDADLILDTGLIPFQREFPGRFVETGIAEQDMVSQAGGMALRGLIPVVHSFSCFLSARPNEQIYNNATERTKIIYVGSLAGLLPAGPGHSHQAVRDISSLSAIPELIIAEPSCEAEVGMLLDWAVNSYEKSSYLRLTSLPWVLSFDLPKSYVPELGQGVTLRDGYDAVAIAYGPIMLSLVMQAAENLEIEFGLSLKVINLPWLNNVDSDWLVEAMGDCDLLFSLDNHYVIGGQGDRLADELVRLEGRKILLHRLALDEIPCCGSSEEVLERHGMSSGLIGRKIASVLSVSGG